MLIISGNLLLDLLCNTCTSVFSILFSKNLRRSAEGRRKKNARNKNRQRVKKGKMKCQLELIKKENQIKKMEVLLTKSRFKEPNKVKTVPKMSSLGTKTAVATHGKFHKNSSKAKDYIICKQEGIPEVTVENFDDIEFVVGSGVFGTVKLGKIKSINLVVAVKKPNMKLSRKSILAEVITLLSLSGHHSIPFCFGIVNGDNILMEFLGKVNGDSYESMPTLAHLRRARQVSVVQLKFICKEILNAVKYIHGRSILHNDIKADNIIVVHNERVVLIDFGKATNVKCPIMYNVGPLSPEYETYETHHRHLAYELRNKPGTYQSIFTDTFSVGYMFKHTAAVIPFQPIIELGKLMKCEDYQRRLTLQVASDHIDSL